MCMHSNVCISTNVFSGVAHFTIAWTDRGGHNAAAEYMEEVEDYAPPP